MLNPSKIADMIAEDPDIVFEDLACLVDRLIHEDMSVDEINRLISEGLFRKALLLGLASTMSIVAGCANKADKTDDPVLQAKLNAAKYALTQAVDYTKNATPQEQQRDMASRARADQGIVNGSQSVDVCERVNAVRGVAGE